MIRPALRSSKNSRLFVGGGVTLALLVGLGPGPGGLEALADERIRFKSGSTMVVQKTRIEGETLFVTISPGNEVGIPLNLVEMTEASKLRREEATNPMFAGRGVPGSQLLGERSAVLSATAGRTNISARLSGESGESQNIGFGYRGAEDLLVKQGQQQLNRGIAFGAGRGARGQVGVGAAGAAAAGSTTKNAFTAQVAERDGKID